MNKQLKSMLLRWPVAVMAATSLSYVLYIMLSTDSHIAQLNAPRLMVGGLSGRWSGSKAWDHRFKCEMVSTQSETGRNDGEPTVRYLWISSGAEEGGTQGLVKLVPKYLLAKDAEFTYPIYHWNNGSHWLNVEGGNDADMCLDVAGVERGDLKGKYFCAMEFKYALKEITERSLNGQIVSQGTCQELRKE